MRHTLYLIPTFALLTSMTTGCGGGAAVTCPDGIEPTTIKGSDFVGVPYAEKGSVCLTQKAPALFPFLGTYEYDDFGTPSEPIVKLSTGSDAVFQVHGVTARQIEWGVAVNPEGKLVGQTGPGGAIVYLFFQYKKDDDAYYKCTPGLVCDNEGDPVPNAAPKDTWDAAQLSISFDRQEMYIFGERILKCADANAACATAEADLKDKISFERN